MKTEPSQTPHAEPVGFIRFHGLTMMTVASNGKEYVPVRPICDLVGVDWQGQKRSLKNAYKERLYGVRWLFPPHIAGFSELKFAPVCHILLNISPSRMQANGNTDAAQWLMALKDEWADALHAYETHSIAIKPGRKNALDEPLKMTRLRNQLTDIHDRRHVDHIIHTQLHALGLPADTLDDCGGA